jgi:hypothetical protein
MKALIEWIENRASSDAMLARSAAKQVVWCWSHYAETTTVLSGPDGLM